MPWFEHYGVTGLVFEGIAEYSSFKRVAAKRCSTLTLNDPKLSAHFKTSKKYYRKLQSDIVAEEFGVKDAVEYNFLCQSHPLVGYAVGYNFVEHAMFQGVRIPDLLCNLPTFPELFESEKYVERMEKTLNLPK